MFTPKRRDCFMMKYNCDRSPAFILFQFLLNRATFDGSSLNLSALKIGDKVYMKVI